MKKKDKEIKKFVDNPNDWFFGALVFAKGLSFTLPEGSGVVIDLKGDMTKLYPYSKRILLAHTNGEMRVMDADNRIDAKEGDIVFIDDDGTKV